MWLVDKQKGCDMLKCQQQNLSSYSPPPHRNSMLCLAELRWQLMLRHICELCCPRLCSAFLPTHRQPSELITRQPSSIQPLTPPNLRGWLPLLLLLLLLVSEPQTHSVGKSHNPPQAAPRLVQIICCHSVWMVWLLLAFTWSLT